MTTATATQATPAITTQSAAPAGDDDTLMTVEEVAQLLRCEACSVYNLTRKRSVEVRSPTPSYPRPFGLRFFRSDVIAWLRKMAEVKEVA